MLLETTQIIWHHGAERTHQSGFSGNSLQESLHQQKWPILTGSECVAVECLTVKKQKK